MDSGLTYGAHIKNKQSSLACIGHQYGHVTPLKNSSKSKSKTNTI
jgi:hypothetical protein